MVAAKKWGTLPPMISDWSEKTGCISKTIVVTFQIIEPFSIKTYDYGRERIPSNISKSSPTKRWSLNPNSAHFDDRSPALPAVTQKKKTQQNNVLAVAGWMASSRDMWRTALLGEKCKTSKQTKRFTNLILVWANWRGFPDYTLPYP